MAKVVLYIPRSWILKEATMAKKRGKSSKKLVAGKPVERQKTLTTVLAEGPTKGLPGGLVPIPRLASNHNEIVLR